MTIFKTLAAAAVVVAGFAGAAQAVPLNGTFGIKVYSFTNVGGNDADELAQLGNPNINAGNLLASISYTGAINFHTQSPTPDTIGAFLSSAGTPTSFAGSTTAISAPGFGLTSIFVITGSVGALTSGSVIHDDGASLYQGATTVFSAAPPTTDQVDAYTLQPGAFTLVYVEANGLPATLNFDVTSVPEPITLGLFGMGLAGLGLVRRRRA